MRVFSKGKIHFDLVEGVSSSFWLDDESEFFEILSFELEMVDLSFVRFGKHEFGFTAGRDVLEMAPIGSQLVLQLLHARVDYHKQALVDC